MEFLTGRTHSCGQLQVDQVDQEVKLSGWVHSLRDMGGLVFIDLRDRWGITQLVFEPGQTPQDIVDLAGGLKTESSLTVVGKVRLRSQPNPKIPTGQIEVLVSKLCAHVIAPALPFSVDKSQDVNHETRMKWRFLDLRRAEIASRLPFRHKVVQAIREHFDSENFVDVETPILFKSTPEGARDYLVPSRLHPGNFYALPQSPQTLKQVLMSSGLDRYYQIVRCFRDEDLRGDRQPEFTQLDMEMSFVTREDVFATIERCFTNIFEEVFSETLKTPWPRLTYQEAFERFGHDAPDLRFGCEHKLFNEALASTEFKVIRQVLDSGGDVRLMAVPDGAKLSRKEIDGLTELAQEYGAKGLLWFKFDNEGLKGPVTKFFDDKQKEAIVNGLSLKEGDLVLGVADTQKVAAFALHKVRLEVAQMLNLIKPGTFNFLWVVDFPLFEKTSEGALTYNHHPFCFPNPEDRQWFDTDPLRVRAWSYDLVLNGWELGSGSIRNHELELQQKILDLIGVSRQQQEEQFGFLFKALQYGAPPHGGIALGIDRLVTLLGEQSDIREFIAFPKTHKGTDLYCECPSPVDPEQIKELHLEQRRESKNSSDS